MSFKHQDHRHETVAQARECEILGQSSERFEAPVGQVFQTVEPEGYFGTADHGAEEGTATFEEEFSTPKGDKLSDAERKGEDIAGVYATTEPHIVSHTVSTEDGPVFYKIQKSRTSSKFYGKVWDGSQWLYDGRSPLYHLTTDHKVTAEQAKAFGDTYHACCFCGTELTETAEGSSLTGYGPICASKRGLPWTRNAEHADWKGEGA